MYLTPASKKELNMLKKFLNDTLGERVFEKITDVFLIYKCINAKTFYTLINRENKALSRVACLFETCYSAGCPFIEVYDNKLFFHVAAIPILAEFTDHKIIITDKAIELFLYGRDIFKKSIVKFEKPLEKNSYAVILDNKNRAYGIGELLYSYAEVKTLQDDVIVIKNILDVGFYLRSEKSHETNKVST